MFKGTKKDYNSIVAPLAKIEKDLTNHIGNQTVEVANLETEKKDIDVKIANSTLEIKKSQHTADKISQLLGTDFEPYIEPQEMAPILEKTDEEKD